MVVKDAVEALEFGAHVEDDDFERGVCSYSRPAPMIRLAHLDLQASSEGGSSDFAVDEVLVAGPPRVVQVPHSAAWRTCWCWRRFAHLLPTYEGMMPTCLTDEDSRHLD